MRLRILKLEGPRLAIGWAWVAFVVWALLIGAIHLVNTLSGREIVVCNVRRLSGVPCPTCGSTRAVSSVLAGDVLGGVAYNPLVIALLVVGSAVLTLRLVGGRRIAIGLGRRERWAVWAMAVAALALNWWYVIDYHRA